MKISRTHHPYLFGIAIIALAALMLLVPRAAAAQEGGKATLQERYESLRPQLDKTAFGRPLILESKQADSSVQGDLYARLDQPFETLRSSLSQPENWCSVFILHLNNKYCRVAPAEGRPLLVVKVGKKGWQELSSAHSLKLSFQLAATGADYFEARMAAPDGPMSTKDYRIVLSAIPIGPNQSFMHLRYSYSYGRMGKMAMDAYLSTAGRDKFGFTRSGMDNEGKPDYVKGYRGVVERNAMRYYLAIDAFLAAQSQPPEKRTERALTRWFDGTEQYAPQLHEIERGEYLEMKRREIQRASSTPAESVE